MDLLADLNPEQRQAVTHPGGPLLVLAGAGSGKTRVLTYRIAYLIRARDVPPARILAVTFTNRAAAEMRQRLALLLGGAVARPMWIGTFHATCSRILRHHGAAIGIPPTFAVYDEEDQRGVLREAMEALGLDERRYPPQVLHALIGRAKDEALDADRFAARARTFLEEAAARVWRVYETTLRARGALDFDDLICEVLRLFDAHPDVLATYQERFLHVLVDEYQDTNHAQYLLVRALAGRHRNVTVVGDDDQSIYRWRGADVRNILEFERDYPDATVITLTQNYRSTKTILAAAHGVIQHNPHRHPKDLWTGNEAGVPITVYEAADGADEAQFIVDEIVSHRAAGGRLRDVAVLYRTNAQSRLLEEACLRAGLPYQVVGGVRFYERREVKDLLAYLRLVVNPDDLTSLRRALAAPRRGVGETSLQRVIAYAQAAGCPVLEAMQRPEALAEVARPAARALEAFARLIGELRALAARLPASQVIAQAMVRTGYQAMLEAEGTDDALSRLENLRELVTVAQEVEEATGEIELVAFLQHLALVADVDTYRDDLDRVTLMTLHSAKGLEFPVVVIAGLEEGLCPHARAIEEEGGLDEERRLCYVGFTRAKRRLILTHARTRVVFGTTHLAIPSRFLDEIPEALVAVAPPREQWAVPAGGAARAGGAPRGTVRTPDVGARVRHARFGEGQVLEVEGEGAGAIVTVRFAGAVRRLALAYAPLEPAD
ncbi:MAG: UvrD-helicase domain-containing protein [Armatimonadota bacterium]|nr:UvrD-helicase domain-containing protein [Armatimonadota bacterium]MDR7535671.1 UvrD-helicase domain-containing protein [Armatimonadota bacterium]